jgi:hypothetical protein
VSNPSCTYDEDNWSFRIQQGEYPEFTIGEGNMQYLLNVFLNPTKIDEKVSLFNIFYVTEEKQSLILERSNCGVTEVLLKFSKAAAKRWAEQIDLTYGDIIRSYAPSW